MPKTLLRTITNRSPVNLTLGRTGGLFGSSSTDPEESDLKMMELVSTLFGVVDGISTGVAAAEWGLYQGEGPGDENAEEVFEHPALSLWHKPNPFYTRDEFVEAMQQHYELTGEYWWTLSFQGMLGNREITMPFPLEMWVVRPDRIRPVPDPKMFIAGFMYRASGEEVALTQQQVIYAKRQNPLDPYRGLSPLGSLVYELHGERAAAQFNHSFFRNGAMPGGIITETGDLSDPEFEQLMERWNQQHKGASNAHRVGLLERGKYEQMSYSMKDMDFRGLREFNKDTIREAYRFPISKLGQQTASNRATHEAESLTFADDIVIPRLRKLRSSLNDDLLPRFGNLGEGYFFDFVDPSPADNQNEREDLKVAVEAFIKLAELGAEPNETLEAFGLPQISFPEGIKQRPVMAFAPNDGNKEDTGNADTLDDQDENDSQSEDTE